MKNPIINYMMTPFPRGVENTIKVTTGAAEDSYPDTKIVLNFIAWENTDKWNP